MKSKAAIGSHPLHPAVVPLPIGAFSLTLIGDLVYAYTKEPFWYRFSYICMGIGIMTGLLAALFGALDYFRVRMSLRGARIAKVHMFLNLGAVGLYAANFALRGDNGALGNASWPYVFALEIVTFVALGASAWLGGALAFEHKVGVAERIDPEATSIGMSERG